MGVSRRAEHRAASRHFADIHRAAALHLKCSRSLSVPTAQIEPPRVLGPIGAFPEARRAKDRAAATVPWTGQPPGPEAWP